MNDLGKKKLRTWLQKSLADHPENDNGLVAYVEAIVGDAEGPDDDLRERWTEKLDDFLAESSADFTNALLKGVRSGGNFGSAWRGAGGDGGGGSAGGGADRAEENDEAGVHGERDITSGTDPSLRYEDEAVRGDAQDEDPEDAERWVDDGRGWDEGEEEEQQEEDDDDKTEDVGDDDDDDDDDGGGSKSRRNWRRAREEPEEESTQPTPAANGKGGPPNKRARVQSGRGGDRRNNQNGNTAGGRGGRGGQQGWGQQGRGSMAMQMQGEGRGPLPQHMGIGSLAIGSQGMMMIPMQGMMMGHEQRQGGMGPGAGQWGGGDMNVGMPRGIPGGMMMSPMQGRGMGAGPGQWVGGGMPTGVPRGMLGGITGVLPRGLLPSPPTPTGFLAPNGGGRGPTPLPRPPTSGASMAGGRGFPAPPIPGGFAAPISGGREAAPLPLPRPQMSGTHIMGGRDLPAPPHSNGLVGPNGGGRGAALLPAPRPQMSGAEVGGRGGDSFGRPAGANLAGPGGGRAGGGQGTPMGDLRPMGGRGGGMLEVARRDNPMVERHQGPQRSPVVGPVNGPRAFAPAPREGNGDGVPRPGLQDGRQLGMMDGAHGRDARQEFENRPGMDTRRRPDEGFDGRQGPPHDNRNVNTGKGRSVFDRLGAPPGIGGVQGQPDPSARRVSDVQRLHAREASGVRQGGGMQLRPGIQQGSGMQPGPETRQGSGIRGSPTDNQAGPQQLGQGMQRGPNFPEGAMMGNTQNGRGGGQNAWAGAGSGQPGPGRGQPGPGSNRPGRGSVDMQRPGMEQHGGAGRQSPQGVGPVFNRSDVGRGIPPTTREQPRGEVGREGHRSSGPPGYSPEVFGRQMPPREATAHELARQQGRSEIDGRRQVQGQGQSQGQSHHAQAAAQHTGARVQPHGGLNRGEEGRGMGSDFARGGDGGNGRPQHAIGREGPVRGQPQPQPQQRHQQVSSYNPHNVGAFADRSADRRPQPSGGGAPHTGGGSLAWGGFGVVREETPRDHGAGHGTRGFGDDRGSTGSSGPRAGQPDLSRDRFSSHQRERRSADGALRAETPEWRSSEKPRGSDARHERSAPRGIGWAAPKPAPQTTVKCRMVPADVGPVELSQHFAEFGKIVDMRFRTVRADEGGKGEKEALIQFASARQAHACVSSPKAVLGNRFIVVELSEVNLVHVDPHQDPAETANADGLAAARTKAAAAAAGQAARKRAHEELIAQASKTRDVVAQQRVVVLLQERQRVAAEPIAKAKANRDKVKEFLRMMQEKGKPEAEQARYRKMLDTLSAKVLVLEAASPTAELKAQHTKLTELEAEARVMGATIPPPPNPALLTKLAEGGGRGNGAAEVSGGRGGGKGRGKGPALASTGGRGGGGTSEQRVPRSLDNRPTTVKVSGLPESAGEGDLRVHANMAGVVVAAAMLDRPGEGVVKFAERWAAEMFMSKSKSFGGIPLTMSWYTRPFPGSAPAPRQQPTRHQQGPPGSSPTAGIFQQVAPVINDGGDTIKLRLAPVQQGSREAGPRGGSGWGDNFGREEGVAWGDNGTGWGQGDKHNQGSGNGSAGSSPLRLPSVEAGDDDDELYQDMTACMR